MRIDHIAMYVNELEKNRDFFIKYFGAVSNDGYYNSKTGFRSFFLTFDDGAKLEIMNHPEQRDSLKKHQANRIYSSGIQCWLKRKS